jgi:LysM repeat protein
VAGKVSKRELALELEPGKVALPATSECMGRHERTTSTERRRYRQDTRIFVTAIALLAAIWSVSVANAASSEDPPTVDVGLQPLWSAASYVVEAGDTLSAIAAKLGIPTDQSDDWIAAVVSLNALESPHQIVPGEILNLPERAAAQAGTVASVTSPSTANYVVQAGETLSGIAAKFGVSADQQPDWIGSVVRINGLPGPDQVFPGQGLKLPRTESALDPDTTGANLVQGARAYVVQDGESLLAIAAKMGIAPNQQAGWVSAVATVNKLNSPDDLSTGQSLVLPAAFDGSDAAPAAPMVLEVALAPTSVSASAPPTPTQSAYASGTPGPGSATFTGTAMPYSDSLTGNSLACPAAGFYSPNDFTVVAFGPARSAQFPCGSPIEVCGLTSCITGLRKDSCPGCSPDGIDVSRAAFRLLCGSAANSCSVRVRTLP